MPSAKRPTSVMIPDNTGFDKTVPPEGFECRVAYLHCEFHQ